MSAAAALLGGLLVAAAAGAHGYWPPRHGGLMSEGGEISFELVDEGRRLVLFVEDHGEPVATEGAAGQLELRAGGLVLASATLRPDGSNRLVTDGALDLQPAQGAFVRVRVGNGLLWLGRFTLRPADPR